jgi:hypothetical protein
MTAPRILRSDPDLSASPHPLEERLAETVSWGRRRVALSNLPESLRSPMLAPPPATPWPETVHAVAEKRLQQLGRSWRRSLDPLGGGLLLLYFPTLPSSAGRARTASHGYFDDRDAPPWDTWVAYVEEASRSYLAAWVPPEGFAGVTAAMRVSGASLRWLDGSRVELESQFKTRKAGV